MLYDYAIGDEYQWHQVSSVFPNSYEGYEKYTILNKSLAPDSLIYLVSKNTISERKICNFVK